MSSGCYALLDRERNVYLSHPVTVVIRNAPTLKNAVDALLRAASPITVKGVFILNDPGFENCRRPVEAIQKAGYSNIEVVERHLLFYSTIIYNVPLKQTVGAVVFIFGGSEARVFGSEHQVVTVLQKCEKGWKIVKENQNVGDAFVEFPSVSDVVVHEGTTKTALQQMFPGRQLHVKEVPQPGYMYRFFETLVQSDSVTDYDVLPYCFYDVMVHFGDKSQKILLDDVAPFTITKEIDVGDVPTVEIRACEENNDEKPLIKTFKFKSAAFRTVSITINVDKTLLPQVTLKTIATRESDATTVPPPVTEGVVSPNPEPPSIILCVSYSSVASFVVTKFVHEKVIGETAFPTFDDAVAFMKKQAPNPSTAAVVLQYPESATIVQLQLYREKFQTAGFVGVKLVPTDSVTIALFLGSLQTSIDEGQFVALLNASMFYLVTRRKGYLSVREAGPLDQFEVKASKFGLNVHILTEMTKSEEVLHQFLWSCIDKTAPNNYTVNDFCDFDIDIPGHEVTTTRFKEFPVIVLAAIDVSNWKTLEVHLVKSKTSVELLKKFKLKHGTRFVQVIVRADTTCDVTAKMNVIAKLTWPRTFVLSNCEFDDPFATIEAAKKPVEKIVLDPPSVSTRYDIMAMKSRYQKKNLAELDARKSGTSEESSNPADLSTTRDIGVEKVESPTTLPKELSQLELDPLPTTISEPVEKTIQTSNDAKDKKSRSQRRKLARRNAVNNGIVAEPTKPIDLSIPRHDKIDNLGSVPALTRDPLQLRIDSSPTVILKFTSDNRVLIEADETYTGDKQLLAYVRLQSGKAPIVGKDAFDALQTHPDSVFYDITRLLAADFDPDYPHPLWSFKTTRDADGKLLVHGSDNIVTLPIVLFGLVVNSTLLYIKGHLTTDIAAVGLRLPCGSLVNDDDLKDVSEKIGTKLFIVASTC